MPAPQTSVADEARLRAIAAPKLLALIHPSQYPDVLGTSEAAINADGAEATRRDMLEHLQRIAHRRLDGMRTTLQLLASFLVATRGREASAALSTEVTGAALVSFLNAIKEAARSKAASASKSDKGTAAPNRYFLLRAAVTECCFPLASPSP